MKFFLRTDVVCLVKPLAQLQKWFFHQEGSEGFDFYTFEDVEGVIIYLERIKVAAIVVRLTGKPHQYGFDANA